MALGSFDFGGRAAFAQDDRWTEKACSRGRLFAGNDSAGLLRLGRQWRRLARERCRLLVRGIELLL